MAVDKMFKYYVLLLLMTINNIFPFDKIAIAVLDVLCFHKYRHLNPKVIFVFMMICMDISLSFIVNIDTSSLRIFYPLLFLIGAYVLSLSNISIKHVSYLFLPNIVIGIIGVLYALITDLEPNVFAVYAWGKSFLFPICATGVSPTPQVYCTFCVLYIWICLEKQSVDWFFLISIIGVLLSQNRTSYVFVLFVILLYRKKVFMLLIFTSVPMIYHYYDLIMEVFDGKNVSSRSLMRHGFELAYWNSNDYSILFWGLGNNELSPEYSRYNYEGSSYIENGLDFILAISGINGFILFVIIIMFFIAELILGGKKKICLIFLFYMVVNQWMTQEFLASSFFYFILTVLVLKKQNVKLKVLNT